MRRVTLAADSPIDEAFPWEVHCFTNALRNLLRAVRTDEDDPKVGAALTKFDEAIPHAAAVRNIFEHWDQYIEGQGHMQKKGEMPENTLALQYDRDNLVVTFFTEIEMEKDPEGRVSFRFGFTDPIQLDLAVAATAARLLINDAYIDNGDERDG